MPSPDGGVFRDVAIIELEHLVGASKREILERESHHIKANPTAVNKIMPVKDDKLYIECACGAYIRKIKRNLRQHIQGREHPKKMIAKGLIVNSIDGKSEIKYSDYSESDPK